MTRLRFAAFSCALLAASACGEAAAPTGQRGSVTVSAYIDRDASGTLTAGDSALAGVEFALFEGARQVATGTTGADGSVTFANLAPGSYRVEATESTPEGAVLTGNSAPAAVLGFRGGTVRVDFRYAFFPGSISGRVFREDNGTPGFQPGGDTPGAGLTAFLRRDDNGTPGDTIASVTTSAEGGYEFTLLAPGTYFVEFENPGTIDYGESGATRRVTVLPRQIAALDAVFTGSLIVPIAEARAKTVGSPVAVEGSVTAPPGVFTSGTGGANSEIWVQDATGGIAVFSVPTADAAQFPVGQRVRVSGTLASFNGQLQINSPTVTALSGTTTVGPKSVTGAEANALTDEGKLVTISSLRITNVPTGTGGAFNVTGVDAAGTSVTIRVAGTATGLTRSSFVVGETYAVTGVLTRFETSGGTVTPQIKPRFASDVVLQAGTPALVVINEFMANPDVIADGSGEWIELHNAGGTAVDLQGWIIRDNFGVDTIDVSIVLAPGGYVVLSNNANSATNGGITVAFQYVSTIGLANGGDRIVLKDPSETTVDSVAYASGTQAQSGVAMGLVDPTQDNADAGGTNWVPQTTNYHPNNKGTPGARNDGATGPAAAARLSRAAVVSPLPAGSPSVARRWGGRRVLHSTDR